MGYEGEKLVEIKPGHGCDVEQMSTFVRKSRAKISLVLTLTQHFGIPHDTPIPDHV